MPRINVAEIQEKKQHGQKLVMLTAYDFPSARIAEQCGASSPEARSATRRWW